MKLAFALGTVGGVTVAILAFTAIWLMDETVPYRLSIAAVVAAFFTVCAVAAAVGYADYMKHRKG